MVRPLTASSLKAADSEINRAAYLLWWLVNEQDVINGKPHQNNPPMSGIRTYMIAAILDPGTLSEGAHSIQGGCPRDASQLQGLPDSPLASSLQAPSGAAGAGGSAAEQEGALCRIAHALATCMGASVTLYLAPDLFGALFEVVQTRE